MKLTTFPLPLLFRESAGTFVLTRSDSGCLTKNSYKWLWRISVIWLSHSYLNTSLMVSWSMVNQLSSLSLLWPPLPLITPHYPCSNEYQHSPCLMANQLINATTPPSEARFSHTGTFKFSYIQQFDALKQTSLQATICESNFIINRFHCIMLACSLLLLTVPYAALNFNHVGVKFTCDVLMVAD